VRMTLFFTFCQKALKGRPTMQSSPEFLSAAPPGSTDGKEQPQRPADWLYKGLTIAAMLLLLGSLWVF